MRKTSRIRVYDLVKKLGVPKDDVLRVLRELSVGVKSTLSTIDESVAQTVELRLKPKPRRKKGTTVAAARTDDKKKATARLRPRLVRKADTTGKARELLKDVFEKEEEEKRALEEAAAAEAPAETPAAAEPAPKPPSPAPPARPEPPAAAKPAAPRVRIPSIPPPPAAGRRPGATRSLRTSRPTPVAGQRRPFRLAPVATHPTQRPTSQRRKVSRAPVVTEPEVVEAGSAGEVTLSEAVTVKELAEKTGRGSRDLIALLMRKGILATINQTLDQELAIQLCEELGFTTKVITFEEEAIEIAVQEEEKDARIVTRDPVVTVMGHVDHGKTSLLDAIRETDVVASEHGGITQHIGAYHVTRKNRGITFLDTPGHEAFTRMRSRGAEVTDIVVLVVAADDGVMPQTLEAIDHAKAAGVPLVVAMNKIDKPEANIDKVKGGLAEHGVLIEEYGGESVFVPVSAKQKTGIDDLLELILLSADIQELKANPDRPGSGTVIEAKLDRTRGALATVLVQNGTIRVGDPFIAGSAHGKVRAMFDDRRQPVRSAGPSRPVEILGLQGVPQAGDTFQVLVDESKARQIGQLRQLREREVGLRKSTRLTLDSLHEQIAEGDRKDLPLILKGDVQGIVEVLSGRLADLSDEKVKIKILHTATGPITENDVLLAAASDAIIIGFNVRIEPKAAEVARAESVDTRLHNVIYEVEDQIRNAMEGMLEPVIQEVALGHAEVREIFRIRKIGTIAGCSVKDGVMTRKAEVRVRRGEDVVFQGKMGSLKRFKEDVSEVKTGYECGISVDGFDAFEIGDLIEAFRTEQVSAVRASA